jgi:hypothetical protein
LSSLDFARSQNRIEKSPKYHLIILIVEEKTKVIPTTTRRQEPKRELLFTSLVLHNTRAKIEKRGIKKSFSSRHLQFLVCLSCGFGLPGVPQRQLACEPEDEEKVKYETIASSVQSLTIDISV